MFFLRRLRLSPVNSFDHGKPQLEEILIDFARYTETRYSIEPVFILLINVRVYKTDWHALKESTWHFLIQTYYREAILDSKYETKIILM